MGGTALGLLPQTALLVPMGRLADRAGQKRGFVAGMVLFIAASLACGFAPGIWWLAIETADGVLGNVRRYEVRRGARDTVYIDR